MDFTQQHFPKEGLGFPFMKHLLHIFTSLMLVASMGCNTDSNSSSGSAPESEANVRQDEMGASDFDASEEYAAGSEEYAAGGAGFGDSNFENESEPEPEPEPEPETEEIICDEDGPTSLYLSADDSNSQASPVLARTLIESGRYVPDHIVRTYEFLNYADFDYPAPESGVAIHPEMRSVVDTDDQYSLQIGVRSIDINRENMRPMNLVLVLDTSGSMAGKPMELLRQSVRSLVGNLRGIDRISIVKLDAEPALLIDGVNASEIDLEPILAELIPNGVTNVEGAMRLAYQRVASFANDELLNRIVLFSDGGANAGQTSIDLISDHAGQAEEEGIYLVGVGLGEGFNDSLMDRTTDAGKGAYFYLDSAEEADRMFGERFLANMAVAALNVRVNLILPPQWELIVFHGEQVSGIPSEVRPQNLAPNDQMIFSQIIGTCAPDEIDPNAEFSIGVTFTDPRTGETSIIEETRTFNTLMEGPTNNIAKGDAIVAFAEALKTLYPLRETEDAAIEQTCTSLEATLDEVPDSADIINIRRLADRYCRIIRSGEQHPGSCDCDPDAGFASALGICNQTSIAQQLEGTPESIGAFQKLHASDYVSAREGCRFAALSTGQVGEAETIPGQERSCGVVNQQFVDPMPNFFGAEQVDGDNAEICDLAQVQVTLTAPENAQSFSFDFRFFSAEYPDYIGSEFNDSFYAIIEAPSTNRGQATNIAFDANHAAIEINNNYFANPFHPCSERNSGFSRGGSTCWLRTSWPIQPSEQFTLTFSIHDEGDPNYSSTVLLDNLKFHSETAVGMTDPLN
jgi:Ca-activated chloride channel homolog